MNKCLSFGWTIIINFEFTAGVTATGLLIGHKESRDGNDYMKLDQFKFSINAERADIHLNNLFSGNRELGEWQTCSMQSTGSVIASIPQCAKTRSWST